MAVNRLQQLNHPNLWKKCTPARDDFGDAEEVDEEEELATAYAFGESEEIRTLVDDRTGDDAGFCRIKPSPSSPQGFLEAEGRAVA